MSDWSGQCSDRVSVTHSARSSAIQLEGRVVTLPSMIIPQFFVHSPTPAFSIGSCLVALPLPVNCSMYSEGSNRLLMTAMLVGDEFRISQLGTFLQVRTGCAAEHHVAMRSSHHTSPSPPNSNPAQHHDPTQQNSGQKHASGRYIAVVRRVKGKPTFDILSFQCENCDHR